MEPVQVAARFAAFVWYLKEERQPRSEALRFARENWQSFVVGANEGLGRLLICMARPRVSVVRRPAGSARRRAG
jgi:hypothetical protein